MNKVKFIAYLGQCCPADELIMLKMEKLYTWTSVVAYNFVL